MLTSVTTRIGAYIDIIMGIGVGERRVAVRVARGGDETVTSVVGRVEAEESEDATAHGMAEETVYDHDGGFEDGGDVGVCGCYGCYV